MGVWRARAMENLRPPVQAPATLLNPYSALPPATSYFFTFVGFFGGNKGQMFTAREDMQGTINSSLIMVAFCS